MQKQSTQPLLADVAWRDWVTGNFPEYVGSPFAPHHELGWEWLGALRPGFVVPPFGLWLARGGGKSTTIELGTSFCGATGRRKFALFVSGTQDQAHDHLSAVARHFEKLGIGRAMNPYGQSKGWRADRLRADNGFNAAAFGMDTALRGVKLDEIRPDLIVFDDIDAVLDSPLTVEKKITSLTQSILPAGSSDCAVFFCQNLVHENSIASLLAHRKAGFLRGHMQTDIMPAAHDLRVEEVRRDDGVAVHKVVSGTPTWAGQNLELIEHQINTWGLRAFLREAQHEVEGADGTFFDVNKFVMVKELPRDFSIWRKCRAWDLAATENGGDFTSGCLWARHPAKPLYGIFDVVRGQWSSDNVRKAIRETAISDKRFGRVMLRLPQDPGQAGKAQRDQFQQAFAGLSAELKIVAVQKLNKAARAEGQQEAINLGNVMMLEADWNRPVKTVYRLFREDESHEHDDDVDAGSDAFNELAKGAGQFKARSYEG